MASGASEELPQRCKQPWLNNFLSAGFGLALGRHSDSSGFAPYKASHIRSNKYTKICWGPSLENSSFLVRIGFIRSKPLYKMIVQTIGLITIVRYLLVPASIAFDST